VIYLSRRVKYINSKNLYSSKLQILLIDAIVINASIIFIINSILIMSIITIIFIIGSTIVIIVTILVIVGYPYLKSSIILCAGVRPAC
jgi:hypothetical protein